MAKGALFVGWGAIIPGREKTAANVLGEAMEYCGRLQQDGQLDSFEAIVLEPHGGNLEGFVVVRGDKDKLAQLRVDDEFVRMIVGVQLVHTNMRVVWAYTGAEMQSLFAMWDQQEEKLT